jgi:predicted esterase
MGRVAWLKGCGLLGVVACSQAAMPAQPAASDTMPAGTAMPAQSATPRASQPRGGEAGSSTAGPGAAGPGSAGASTAGPGAAGPGSAGSSTAGASAAGSTPAAMPSAPLAQAGQGGGAAGTPASPADAGAPEADAAAADSAALTPPKEFLPAASGPCPSLRDGYVMFAPDGMQRRVLLYMSDAAMELDGPLIFSWHSTLPNPEDASSWLGRSVIEEIKAKGGIVAAPSTGYPSERRPWDNTPLGAQGVDGDQRLMDEIVACAHEQVGIDLRHIHATGMSAGGLKSADVSLRRSGYLASVVVYSGGLTEGDMPPDQDPNNKLAAMILYGGPSDISPVDGINYTDASNRYRDLLKSNGRSAFLCNHGGGHSVPQDSQASAWRFMQDHPYGVTPDPYAQALPDGFLRYCEL